ncbi:MAG: sulfotransferase [Proteobacteria bacterium]|nr:sulfotransferase [Pseudomonadota bacterium]
MSRRVRFDGAVTPAVCRPIESVWCSLSSVETDRRIAAARAAFGAGRTAEAERIAAAVLAERGDTLDAIELMALARRAAGDGAGAERWLRRAIAVAPGRRWPHDDLAELLCEAGRAVEAEAVCRAALAADRDNANAAMMLGNLLSEREELVEGAVWLRHAIALAGDHPQLLANLGRNLQRQGALDAAEPLLRKAVAAMPDALPPLAWLAELLEQARRFDEAATMLDRAGRLAKAQGSDVTLQRAALLSRTAEWRAGLALLDAEPELSGAALLQRGRLRDRAGRHDEAWADFIRGKAALAARSGRRYDRAGVARLITDLRTFFAAASLAPAPVRADVPQPIFILGFPRSGTTLTEQVLASHSRIRAGGELPFVAELAAIAEQRTAGAFPAAPDRLDPHMRATLATDLRDHYLARAAAFGLLDRDAGFFTDKMPLNELYLPLLRLAFPAAPLVAVKRHPLDVMVSAMSHDFTHGFDCGYRLEDAAHHFAVIDALVADYEFAAHTLVYERFVAAQQGETDALMAHIGLPTEPAQLAFHESRRFAPTPSYAQVQEPLNDRSIGRWKNYVLYLAPARAILREAIARGGYVV